MCTQAFCHFNNHMIITNPERAVLENFNGNMTIADMPCHTRCFDQTMTAQIRYGLRGSDNTHKAAILKHQSVPV